MPQSATERLLVYFLYDHLPDDGMPSLRKTGCYFHDLAMSCELRLPDGPEKLACMEKLLEAQDAAFRAHRRE